MKLRPYQQEALDSVVIGFKSSQKLLVVIPTGGEKRSFSLILPDISSRARRSCLPTGRSYCNKRRIKSRRQQDLWLRWSGPTLTPAWRLRLS